MQVDMPWPIKRRQGKVRISTSTPNRKPIRCWILQSEIRIGRQGNFPVRVSRWCQGNEAVPPCFTSVICYLQSHTACRSRACGLTNGFPGNHFQILILALLLQVFLWLLESVHKYFANLKRHPKDPHCGFSRIRLLQLC